MMQTQSPVGETLDSRFTILSLIGEGGFGTVYLAEQIGLDRKVAVKFILPIWMEDRDCLERFNREARIMGELQHANIAACYGHGLWRNRTPFIAFEYVEGKHLLSRLREEKALSWRQVFQYGIQICSALQYIHERGLIHRDLKPDNIIVTADDTVKLIDFGLVHVDGQKLTQTGAVVGSFFYLSPEQGRGQTSSPASDIYSLGCVLYHLISGMPPFFASSPGELLHLHQTAAGESIRSAPPVVNQILGRAMEKIEELRYSSAEEMAKDMQRALEGRFAEIEKPPVSLVQPKQLHVSREFPHKRLLIGMLLAGVVVAGGLFALSVHLHNQENDVETGIAADRLDAAVTQFADAVGLSSPAEAKRLAPTATSLARSFARQYNSGTAQKLRVALLELRQKLWISGDTKELISINQALLCSWINEMPIVASLQLVLDTIFSTPPAERPRLIPPFLVAIKSASNKAATDSLCDSLSKAVADGTPIIHSVATWTKSLDETDQLNCFYALCNSTLDQKNELAALDVAGSAVAQNETCTAFLNAIAQLNKDQKSEAFHAFFDIARQNENLRDASLTLAVEAARQPEQCRRLEEMAIELEVANAGLTDQIHWKRIELMIEQHHAADAIGLIRGWMNNGKESAGSKLYDYWLLMTALNECGKKKEALALLPAAQKLAEMPQFWDGARAPLLCFEGNEIAAAGEQAKAQEIYERCKGWMWLESKSWWPHYVENNYYKPFGKKQPPNARRAN